MSRNCLNVYLKQQEQIIEMYWKDVCCNISIRIAYRWHHSRISLRISQTGTTQTAGAQNNSVYSPPIVHDDYL